jgi:hypothetical protein
MEFKIEMFIFLLKYTATNSEGYYMVYEKDIDKAIEKLENHLFFLSNLHIENCTI